MNWVSINKGWSAAAIMTAVFVGGLGFSSAKAADLGGDCCADLEERVAELEATTVRKGNRKVSVKVSGFVSKSVMFWDDGTEQNVYVGDTNGGTLSSNFSITGSASIAAGWNAGYDIVIETDGGTNMTGVNQNNDNVGNNITTLVSSMWIKSDHYGKLSWGKQSQASDNAALLPDLSGTIIQSNYVQFHGGSFILRQNGTLSTNNSVWLNVTPCATSNAGIANDCNGLVLNNVRYDTPTIAGFTLSTSWGEDDFWDIAVNYAGQWGDVKVKAAYAYTNTTDGDTNFNRTVDFHQVGASALHVPTGLFIYGAYVTEDYDDDTIINGPAYTDDGWYLKAGIRQRWNPLGETIIYGEYQGNESKFFNATGADVDYANFDMYGVGVVQYIDAAAMQLHAVWKHKEAELEAAGAADLGLAVGDVDDFDLFLVGGTIFF